MFDVQNESRKKRIDRENIVQFYRPEVKNLSDKLAKNTQTRQSIEKSRVAKNKQSEQVIIQNISGKVLQSDLGMVRKLDDLMKILHQAESTPDKRRSELVDFKTTYLQPPSSIPLSDIPIFTQDYIQQYTIYLEDLYKKKRLRMYQLKKVGLNIVVFSLLAGVPILISTGLILDPSFTIPVLQKFIPDTWVESLNNRKTQILYHAIMTMVPLAVQGPSSFILSSLTSNYSVRIFLTSNLRQLSQTYISSSPIIGNIFTNTVYANISDMASRGKEFILAIKSKDELEDDMIRKIYSEKLKEQREFDRIYRILSSNKTQEEMNKEIKNIEKQETSSVLSRILYYLKKAATKTGSLALKYKYYAFGLCGIVGIYWWFKSIMDRLLVQSFPIVLNAINFFSDLLLSIGGFLSGSISFDQIIAMIKTYYPPSLLTNKLMMWATYSFFPLLFVWFLNILSIPSLLDGLFKRLPGLKQKIGQTRGLKEIRQALSWFYGAEIEWDIAYHTILTKLFVKTSIMSIGDVIQNLIPTTTLTNIITKLDASTVTLFCGGMKDTLDKIFSDNPEGNIFEIWNSLTAERLFPQFVEHMKFIQPGTELFSASEQSVKYIVERFDNFSIYLSTPETIATSSTKIKVDLISNASFFKDLTIFNDINQTYESFNLEGMVQGAVAEMLTTLSSSSGEALNKEGLTRTITEILQERQNILSQMKIEGFDLVKFSGEISNKIKEVQTKLSLHPETLNRIDQIQQITDKLKNKEKVIDRLFLLENYDEIFLEVGDTQIYKNIREKKERAELILNNLSDDIQNNEERLKNSDEIVKSSLENLEKAKELIKNEVAKQLGSIRDFIQEKRDRPREIRGLLNLPEIKIDTPILSSEIQTVYSQNEKNVSNFTEREKTLISNQVSTKNILQTRLENANLELIVAKETFLNRFKETIVSVGFQNTMNYTLANVNALDLTLLVNLLHKFSEYGDITTNDLPETGLESLNNDLSLLNDRNEEVMKLLKESIQDNTAKCSETDKYSWDLQAGMPLNEITKQHDMSFSPCYSDAGIVKLYSALQTGSSTAQLATLGIPGLGPVISLISTAADIFPAFYSNFKDDVQNGTDSIPELIHLVADIICASRPSSTSGKFACSSYSAIVSSIDANSKYPPMTPAAKLRTVDLLYTTSSAAFNDKRFQNIIQKTLRNSFGVKDSEEIEQNEEWERLDKEWMDREMIEFTRRREQGEFISNWSDYLSTTTPEERYLGEIEQRQLERKLQNLQQRQEIKKEQKEEQKRSEWSDYLKQREIQKSSIKPKSRKELMLQKRALNKAKLKEVSSETSEEIQQILPSIETYEEWSKQWDLDMTELDNGLTFDDVKYLFTNDVFKSIGRDLLLGHKTSSSIRQVYDQWWQKRVPEIIKQTEESEYWDSEEKAKIISDVQRGLYLGLDLEYATAISYKLGRPMAEQAYESFKSFGSFLINKFSSI